MTLPTRPNAIFSTLQGTQNPDTKETLQRAKNANAQPTHSAPKPTHRPADGVYINFILNNGKTATITRTDTTKLKF